MNSTEANDIFNPDLLAGYADGELDSATRTRVEAHLAAHPEFRSEVGAQRVFGRKSAVWSRVAAPSPSDAAWNRTLGGIRNGLNPAAPSVAERGTRSGWKRVILAVSGLAAAVAVAIAVVPMSPISPTVPAVVNGEDVLPITVASEVDIFSIQGDDSVIVVGNHPLAGQMELVVTGDFALDVIRTDPDGRDTKGTAIAGDKPVIIVPGSKAAPTLPTP